MNTDHLGVSDYIIMSIVAGAAGAIAMYGVMRIINTTGWTKGDMILAVGSLVTKQLSNAFAVGTAIHLATAIIFAFLYLFALSNFGFTQFPLAVAIGAFFGVLHGIIVSLALVWVVSDQHPLEEFRSASLPIGIMHFAGHVAYGATVGLVISAFPIS